LVHRKICGKTDDFLATAEASLIGRFCDRPFEERLMVAQDARKVLNHNRSSTRVSGRSEIARKAAAFSRGAALQLECRNP
jgi:hypothetical protein